ncbi:YcgL domain-containing protein [Enterovibrio makurazakiensis]|uniref:YcgL domain-containing protein LRP50_07215 n=1 Tax=Enterovibrio gelatinilyticus TaxID=2899819 RepID=A0ABT5R048_9GAMM|nr:YcgL domain-containing protein [Enterovibrio sp. ZSDZ42]MDD1792912.1 YcgL domain-containing protein [Enterovibrio sp. ZSDZ42]
MYCAIYKSSKKESTYLYVNRKDDLGDVPQQLLQTFGNPQFVMMVNLDKREKLAIADLSKVKESLQNEGFYLQLPPPPDGALLHIRTKNTKL